MFLSATDYSDMQAVANEYPDTVEVVPVEGGWMVFESADGAAVWANQV